MHQQGDISSALAGYESALREKPDNPLALRLGGIAARELGDIGQSLEWLRAATALSNPNPDAFCELALSHMIAGSLIDATATFRKTINQFPNFPKALANFGALLQYRGHVGEAAQIYEDYLALEPQDLEIRCNLAKCLVDLGKGARAIEEAENTCRQSNDHPRALSNLGSILLDTGDLENAEALLLRVSEDGQGDELSFVNLGSLYLSTHRPAEACRVLKEAIRINPNHAQANADYTIALTAAHDLAQAMEISETFLRAHPGERSVLAAYAYALGAGQAPDRAERLFDYDSLLEEVELDLDVSNDQIASFVCGHPSLNENPVSKATLGGSQTGELDFAESTEIAALSAALVDAVHTRIGQLLMSNADDLSLMRAPPRNWTLRLWGTVLQQGGRQTPHIHPLGWISGVYYARIPEGISGDPTQNGWLEFGPPPPKYDAIDPLTTRSVEPREGKLVLFPSYFYHCTKALRSDTDRVSLAFDVVPSFEQLVL